MYVLFKEIKRELINGVSKLRIKKEIMILTMEMTLITTYLKKLDGFFSLLS